MAQEELDALLVRVADQARAVNIPISRHICPHVRLNRRARTRFGCCIRRGGTHTIELSAQLVREGGQEAVARVLGWKYDLGLLEAEEPEMAEEF